MTLMATQSICRPAPAKVNLSLSVLGRRPDGFHDIESWIAPIDWCDRITATPGNGPAITVDGDTDGIPLDDTNLAMRAAEALARVAGHANDAAIRLEKSIPPGAGLGGGSSDAATVLLALNSLWSLNLSTKALTPIAAEIGSDVPFFLEPGSAIIRGRGERIERLDHSPRGWLVLIVPPFGISTGAVYRVWSMTGEAESNMCRAVSHHDAPWLDPSVDAASLMPRLFNDLESAAFSVEPRLATLHSVLDGLEGCPVRMTGSGSTLFTLFDDESYADAWRRAARGLVQPDVMIHVVAVC